MIPEGNPESSPDLTIEEAIDLYCRRKRPNWRDSTERAYRRDLGKFQTYAEETDIETLDDLERYNVGGFTDFLLGQDLAKATVNTRQKSIRTWLKFLEAQGYVQRGLHLAIDPLTMTDDEQTSDQKLAAVDARQLLTKYRISPKWKSTRRHALLEILWHTGCRFSGVQSLDLKDYDQEEGILKFRHRPESGTKLKEGKKHERNVIISEGPREVLNLYIARERIDQKDDYGRNPLFTTRQGRAARATIRGYCYEATQPCAVQKCPHPGRERDSCEWVPRDSASKCPSTRPTHAIRRGSITWQRNLGFDEDTVAQRVAATPDVIRRYYDDPDYEDELERRRHMTEEIDLMDHLDPTDLTD